MLSINTNLSSFIAQNSMRTSTNKLNQAIERMSTGAKLNHAKDNAANYSISTNLTTRIGAYSVAEDNTAMGLDMVSTASDTISQMQSHGERLRALATQARNGTYGSQSLKAIQSESDAITKEIERLYNSAEYNGVSLFNQKDYEIASHLPQAGESGFIDEGVNVGKYAEAKYNGFIENPVTYTDTQLAEMLASGDIVALDNSVTSFTNGQKYLISDKSELERLATLVNGGKDSTGAIFILGADIDLKNEEWTPIGSYTIRFRGIFDGNGHKISNFKIDNPTADNQGLFGYIQNATIKNVSIENGNINGNAYIGCLIGTAGRSTVLNCNIIGGNILGNSSYIGGLIGNHADTSIIRSCYVTGNITGLNRVGGLVGQNDNNSTISNCYAESNIVGRGDYTGGLTGLNNNNSIITNCYAIGNVYGFKGVGGLIGENYKSTIIDSYATGDVNGQDVYIGGLVGINQLDSIITNCYATGNVIGESDNIGGLVGRNINNSNIVNCYATGEVTGEKNYIGGLVGCMYASGTNMELINSAFYGCINSLSSTSGSFIGGIVKITYEARIINCEIKFNNKNIIGAVCKSDSNIIPDYDMSSWLNEIEVFEPIDISTNLQVGVHGNSSSRISFNTNFKLDFTSDIASDSALDSIDEFLNLLSEKSTMLGSVSNRLESVLDEIEIQYTNLVSSRSTIRDANIAKVSAEYIQQQILQQAAATLMSTANQSPAIALQLI